MILSLKAFEVSCYWSLLVKCSQWPWTKHNKEAIVLQWDVTLRIEPKLEGAQWNRLAGYSLYLILLVCDTVGVTLQGIFLMCMLFSTAVVGSCTCVYLGYQPNHACRSFLKHLPVLLMKQHKRYDWTRRCGGNSPDVAWNRGFVIRKTIMFVFAFPCTMYKNSKGSVEKYSYSREI